MQKLASHYKISIDQFFHLQSDSFVFSGDVGRVGENVFERWMENVLKAGNINQQF
ncbi:MAG: hypothetical protein WDM90_09875 [Ferruginibacter sp.]